MSDIASAAAPVQVEASRFRSAVSESLIQGMGANINFLLEAVLPIGAIVSADLTEAQFQDQTSTKWVLMDGRSVTGSAWAVLTGNSNIADARGLFLRGKNNARSTATGDAAGERTLGAYQADEIGPHTHGISTRDANNGSSGIPVSGDGGGTTFGGNTGANTGLESRPRNIAVNWFIRIN